MSSITAIILTKNSAATLTACLSSVSFCDKIIVADDGSTDATHAIAKTFGVMWFTIPQTISFAAKRNVAMKQVTTDWIFFVDSDEVVTEQLQAEITKTIEHTHKNGFFIPRFDIFMGRNLQYGETGSISLLRLFRTGYGVWNRRVHEYVQVKGNTGKLKGVLIHTPHPNLDSFLKKINTYTDLEVQERTDNHTPSNIQTYCELALYPIAKFIVNYIFLRGFLDGIPGLCMSYMMSLHSLIVRIKILEYIRHQSQKSTI